MEIQTTIHSHKKPIKISIISSSIFLIIYLGISMYFRNHFYYGSVINGINVSGKTVAEVNKALIMKSETYTLKLKERNGVSEQIKASDIDLKYNINGKIQVLKDNQNPFRWIYVLFNPKASEISGLYTYNENLLKENFNKLAGLDTKNVIEPKNPSFKYSDKGYVIVAEVNGNKINSKLLYASVSKAINKGETTIDLEAEKHYINPQYTTTSKEVKNTKTLLDKYIASNITYTFTEGKQVLDGSIVHKWLSVNKNLEILFDKDKMKDYLGKLDNKYDTYGKERDFVTSFGQTVKVSGGNYGWLVKRAGEVNDLIASIKKGQTMAKEPKYTHTSKSHDINDIGNTYVEINMTKQHMWFYKNGSLIVEGDIVTGNVSLRHGTPTGVYNLAYKEKNATLKGEGYSTPVDVFMPFNGGIGIHDASWRNKFGGSIYLTSGSHGCINSPPYLAKAIYNNINANTPVVCYFE